MTGACPGDDTLIALVEHMLEPARVATLADHVDGCERCRATIGHLAAVDPTTTPAQVGRYQLAEQLGAGGMGIVWAAWDPMLERRVAIKLLRPEAGEHGPARLLREARALAQLQHPNVVAVYDVGEHDGEVFLATELVDGEPLDRWQRTRAAAEIIAAYVQTAHGLAAAHAMGLVHRDVKPSNILVARDGRVRVGDFGLARRESSEATRPRAGELPRDGASRLTRDGDVVGTPAYMAPEQRACRAVDGRADQYALCVALAEALAGTRPGPDATVSSLGALEPWLAAALARGLRRDPVARHADMTALATALASAPRPRPRLAWLLGALVAATLVTGTGLAVRGFDNSPRVVTPSAAGSSVAVVAVPARDASVLDAAQDASPPRAPSVATLRARVAPPPPAGIAAVQPAGVQPYLDALALVTRRDRACKAAFARFDALKIARPQIPARDDTLQRARCELLAGNCPAGERAIAALLTREGLSAPTIADEVAREVRTNCPTSIGTWQARLDRLGMQGPHVRFGTLAQLQRELASAEAVVRDARGAMSRSERIDLTNALGWIEEGFARFADHCADARRARQLGDYDPPAMTEALKQCLAGTAP